MGAIKRKTAQQSVHLTLGILRKSQAVFYAFAFFQLDGFAVPAPAQVTQTVGRQKTEGVSSFMKNPLPLKLYAKNRYLLVVLNIILLFISGNLVFPNFFGNGQQMNETILPRVIGSFSLLFFGYGFLTSLRMIFQPAILIDDEGIVDRASGTAVGRIPWSNVSKAEVISGSNYVGIVPKDINLIDNHVGIFVRSMLKRRVQNGRPPIIIPASILGIDAVQLTEEINRHKPLP